MDHIFLLHGLGSHAYTLWPLGTYLKCKKKCLHVHYVKYPVDRLEFDEMVNYVDEEMAKVANKSKDHVILIGQSMGGVVANNLHTKGWKIKKAIYLASPLHGANLLNQLEKILPVCIKNLLYKKPYDFLKRKERETEPPHEYKTVSFGWAWSSFDGCVYKQEAILDEKNHTHLSWADHRTIFANPRLWVHVGNLIE